MLNKTITIDSLETKQAKTGNWKYIIKDTDGDKFYFYKDTKNGLSEAYQTFDALKLANGDIIMVSYTEEDKSFTNADGKNINYKDRFISNILQTGTLPLPSQEKPHSVSNNASQDNFGTRLAIHGMVNGLLASGKSPQEVIDTLPMLWVVEEEIDERLKKPNSLNTAEAHIKSNYTPDVEDIPF